MITTFKDIVHRIRQKDLLGIIQYHLAVAETINLSLRKPKNAVVKVSTGQ